MKFCDAAANAALESTIFCDFRACVDLLLCVMMRFELYLVVRTDASRSTTALFGKILLSSRVIFVQSDLREIRNLFSGRDRCF